MKLCVCLLYTAVQVTVGCIISGPKNETIIRSPGESVVLHCSCTHIQIKPEKFQWFVINERGEDFYVTEEQDINHRFNGRAQIFNANSPGNASLFLSELTEEDQGQYRCEIKSGQSWSERRIELIVKGVTEAEESSSRTVLTNIMLLLLVVVLVTAAVIYWRYRKRTNGSPENNEVDSEQKQKQDEEVTYSTIVHGNPARPPPNQTNAEERTEYSSIKLDRV